VETKLIGKCSNFDPVTDIKQHFISFWDVLQLDKHASSVINLIN